MIVGSYYVLGTRSIGILGCVGGCVTYEETERVHSGENCKVGCGGEPYLRLEDTTTDFGPFEGFCFDGQGSVMY